MSTTDRSLFPFSPPFHLLSREPEAKSSSNLAAAGRIINATEATILEPLLSGAQNSSLSWTGYNGSSLTFSFTGTQFNPNILLSFGFRADLLSTNSNDSSQETT
jgi:hypothetical protein